MLIFLLTLNQKIITCHQTEQTKILTLKMWNSRPSEKPDQIKGIDYLLLQRVYRWIDLKRLGFEIHSLRMVYLNYKQWKGGNFFCIKYCICGTHLDFLFYVGKKKQTSKPYICSNWLDQVFIHLRVGLSLGDLKLVFWGTRFKKNK